MKGGERIDLPRVKGELYGKRSLRYRGARLWNALDQNIRELDFKNFKSEVKKHDFDEMMDFRF